MKISVIHSLQVSRASAQCFNSDCSAHTAISDSGDYEMSSPLEEAHEAVAVICRRLGGTACATTQRALEDAVARTVMLGESAAVLDNVEQGVHRHS